MRTAEDISEMIQSFKELSGVGICFYDLQNFFSYGTNGKKENSGHYCSLCRAARLLNGGRDLCDKSDRRDAVAAASDYQSPFFTRCHLGLCELVVPIYARKKLTGIVFLGQCRLEGEDASQTIRNRAAELGGNGEEFCRLYQELPLLNRRHLLTMGRIFQLYFENLTRIRECFPNEIVQEPPGQSIAQKVSFYIEKHYMEPISSQSISQAFYLNQSYLARAFKKEFGCTVTDYIVRTRMTNAKKLLEETSVSIKNIALNVGFPNSSYFSRVFEKTQGIPPTVYRARVQA